jgi:phosphoglycolate phosphatase-like HAD superfamily hydrolase
MYDYKASPSSRAGDLMNYPAASSGVSKFQRFGESQAQQAAGNMTPRDLNALAALNARSGNEKPIEAPDCVVIEDSKEGIRGALRAGMKCLAVTNSHPADLLSEATAVVKSLEDVKLNFLQNMCP